MLEYARNAGVAHENTKWIWRCHIDLTDANPTVWKFFQGFVEQYDASVWTMPQFVPDGHAPRSRGVRAAVHRPALGQEPRDAAAVRRGDRPPVRRARQGPARGAGEPVRSLEGPGRRHRGVPDRARGVPRPRSSCSRAPWPPTIPRASTTGSSPTRPAPATPTSTSCRTSSRSARCRSTRSSARPTS